MARWLGRVAKAQRHPHQRAENLKQVFVSLEAALTRIHQIDDLMDGPRVERQCTYGCLRIQKRYRWGGGEQGPRQRLMRRREVELLPGGIEHYEQEG